MYITLGKIIEWLLVYRYAMLFPIVAFEGPISTVIAGFLASQGHFNLYLVYPLVVAADLTGDSIYYAFGYFSRKSFIVRWGHRIHLPLERIEKLEEHFRNHSSKTLFTAKLAHGVGAAVLAAAGLAHMPFKRFLWINFLGTVPKSFILLLIGFYFGAALKELNNYFNLTSFLMIGLAILLTVIYFLIVRFAKSQSK